MSIALPQRTSVTLPEDLRVRIEALPDEVLPEDRSTSGLIRWLVERGVAAEEEAVEMRAYAELGSELEPYREARRSRRNRTMARQAAALGEEPIVSEESEVEEALLQVTVHGEARVLPVRVLRSFMREKETSIDVVTATGVGSQA